MADGSQLSVDAPHVAVVEHQPELALLLHYNLRSRGYQVAMIDRGDDAAPALRDRKPDLAILDWTLPGLSGIELLRHLRATPATRSLPVVVLTERSSSSDIVRAYDNGADAVVARPFTIAELMLRINEVIVRRSRPDASELLIRNGIRVDPVTLTASSDGKSIQLTPSDCRLLELFLTRANSALTRREIINAVWGHFFIGNERLIDDRIQWLRARLAAFERVLDIRSDDGASFRCVGP